jgi:hypothetical protein
MTEHQLRSEPPAHLEGFMVIFHRAPQTGGGALTGNLDHMSEYWTDATPDTRKNVLKRLEAYYKGLDDEHKALFDQYIGGRKTSEDVSEEVDKTGPFWNHVAEDVISGA